MKPWSWIFVGAVAATLAIVAGCHRTDRQPDQDSESHARQPQVRLRPRQVVPPQKQVRLDPPKVRPVELSAVGAEESPARTGAPQPQLAEKGQSDAIFTNSAVLRLEIDIPRSGLNSLRKTGWGNGGGERPMAKVVVREGGRTYTNVAAHLKGAAGSFRGIDDKPALTLTFDKFVPGQSFHGLHKISLNNSIQDSTYLSEKICRELMIAAGVPVPRAGHALVTLNGRELGLYVVLEGANKQFLKHFFSNTKGNLYDGGFCQDLDGSLTINCGDDPKNNGRLGDLINIIYQGRPTFARLSQVLDTDRFISMLAMEMMLFHWDGYTLNKNNWRVFHDQESNKMVFIPHGMDQMFGASAQFDPGTVLKPQHISGAVARAVLGTDEGRRRYRERVGQLYTNVFNVSQISSRLDEIGAGMAASLAQSDPQTASQVQRYAARLKQRIIQRAAVLRRQLGVPATPVDLGRAGVMSLTGWKPSLVQTGDPTLTQVTDPSGKPLLSISAGSDGVSSSSWRTRVTLGTGRYQFEGRIRLEDVAINDGDKVGGVDLRISKGAQPRRLTGTLGWTDYKYPFTVEEDGSDIELVCELRSIKGQAWFDPSSLRLVRLP